MRVYFNDLTLSDDAQSDIKFISEFAAVWKGFRSITRSKCGKLVADAEGLACLHSVLSLLPLCDDKNYLSSQVVMTFQKSDGDDGDEFDRDDLDYYEKHIFVYTGPDFRERDAKMMGWAALNRSLTLGLFSRPEWKDLHHIITEEWDEGSKSRDVMCVTKQSHNDDKDVRKWVEMIDEVESAVGLGDIAEKQICGKIVVIGVHDRNPLRQVVKSKHFDPDCFEFLETGDMQRYDCERWKNNKNIAAIMVGAIPHSIRGLGDYNSLIDKLNSEKEWYPPFVELQNELGELKCTKSSFAKGLDRLFNNEQFKEKING